MFPACHAEMLRTLWLKTWELPVLTGSVQVRLVMFTTGQCLFKYGRLVCAACWEVESWYLTMTGRQVLPDKMAAVSNKT